MRPTRFIAFALLLPALARPVGASCTCTVTASVSGTTVNISATSAGTCSSLTEVRLASGIGSWGPPVQCFSSTSCTANTSWSTSCLSTGEHVVRALCSCGQAGTSSSGSPTCSTSWSDTSATYSVYTTPSIGLSASGPDASGRVQFSMPYSFPNTISHASRDLYFMIDGMTRMTAYSDTVSGTWAPAMDMSCWDQGVHDLRAVAIACDKGDPSYRADAFGSVTIDHEPTVSLSLTPAPGGAQAQVGYSFPQTRSYPQRRLQLKAYPSGTELASFQPTNQTGTWTTTVGCSSGARRLLVAVAAACDDTRVEDIGVLPDCPKPPREHGPSCPLSSGPGGTVPVGGDGPGFGGDKMGPGAELFYQAGGVGNPANPGEAAWRAILGRNWSHDYAERLVPLSSGSVVWLITRHGTFRKFDLYRSATGLYDRVSPTDETRKLKKTATGWELRSLDGTLQVFNSTGLWQSTRDRFGNTKTATYTNGRLDSVGMPDGRSETFGYHASGKLASITEVGVGGAAQRAWSYGWVGDDLVTIERPDGTGWRFVYGDPRHPGYMTRRLLVGADDGDPATPRPERVEGAWEYDDLGNVVRAWMGSDDFATGIERHEFAYDEPIEPRVTTVTIHRSATEQEVVTYTLSRPVPWVGGKPRLESITGSCSGCGLGPDTQMSYDDSRHPLRPTRIVDGRGVATEITYDANGQVTSRLEAAETPLARETRWEYHPTFPELATRIEGPGPIGFANARQTRMSYDAVTGALLSSTVEGEESTYPGGSFSLTTMTQPNAAGQPLVIDPPGHGTADQTVFTYDPTRGNLLPLSRTDPLVGATTFTYDHFNHFNRQVTTTDPNGVTTVTAYDALDRVISVTQQGATPAEDLVTRHFYDAFGDLSCTQLPRGNGTEYVYDGAGRLTEIRHKADCDPDTQALERTVYVLNDGGQRIEERQEVWTGTAWETKSETGFVYANRCQLAKVIRPRGGSLPPAVTEYSYDCSGNLEKVWDANHPRSSHPPTQVYAYDALNRLASVSQPWTGGGATEAVTTYGYDLQDHLTSVTDAEGNVTTYAYSDRDLLTSQDSPVSGVTAHQYADHGELLAETDARGITVERELDALGRVLRVDYPDDTLDTTYVYDDPVVPFSKGRLTAITRPGSTIAYTYDRFGRLLQDGALTYGYDENGNRVELGYPGGVVARYGFDFADRESSLEIQAGSGPVQPLVTGATYLPSGPLAQLTLGNGLVETRTFDPGYHPESITIPGRLEQLYTTDAEGNIRTIDRQVGQERFLSTFDYQDPQYFLTQGNGPWGQQSWTYDRIGNRLSDAASAYTYTPNPSGGHTPKLSRIDPAPDGEPGSFLTYGFDTSGNQTTVSRSNEEGPGRVSSLEYNAESRLSRMSTSDGPAATELLYDGRGYLRRSRLAFSNSTDFEQTEPTYSSEGLLYSRRNQRQVTQEVNGDEGPSSTTETSEHTTHLFYFAGRPVAQWRRGSADELLYLTTDHLGTPILASDAAGGAAWEGGIDPFGEPYVFPCRQGPGEDGDAEAGSGGSCVSSRTMEDVGIFLRFPGQWDDASFRPLGAEGNAYYNVYRWYKAHAGRYTRPDPLGLRGGLNLFAYAGANPINGRDPLGLLVQLYCAPVGYGGGFGFADVPGALGYKHCFIRIGCDCPQAYDIRLEVVEQDDETGRAVIPANPPKFEAGHGGSRVAFLPSDNDSKNCTMESCVLAEYHRRRKIGQPYGPGLSGWLRGPNSNTFARDILTACGVTQIFWPTGVSPFTEPK